MPITRRIAMLCLPWMAATCLVTISLPAPALADQAGGTTIEDLCAPPALGVFNCDARVIVSKKTQQVIRPVVQKTAKASRAISFTGTSAPAAMTPAYLQQAYDLTYLSATQGIGDTVAVVGIYNAPTAAVDLATFRSTYHLPACTIANGCFKQLNEQGQASPLPQYNAGWAQEEEMDLDAVSAICPNCKIDLVEASTAGPQDLQAAIVSSINLGAKQVSISGAGRFTSDPFTGFNHAGVSIFAAAGDEGAIPDGQANYPAALPYVNAVGGTSLNPGGANNPTARGVSESVWSASGSGCATQEMPLPYQSALGCSGRLYSDVSADADPLTGLSFYDSQEGGWVDGGGTSLSTPLTAAFAAVTGVDATTSQWAYDDAQELNPTSSGAVANCTGHLYLPCAYTAATGAGSISGDIVAGAPGIGDPAYGNAHAKNYVVSVRKTWVKLAGGVYPNNQDTQYYWQYGSTDVYDAATSVANAGSFAGASAITTTIKGLVPGTTYHYRLVAVNASGTTYGYDYWFKTGSLGATPISGMH